jgi:hypothetical protein
MMNNTYIIYLLFRKYEQYKAAFQVNDLCQRRAKTELRAGYH